MSDANEKLDKLYIDLPIQEARDLKFKRGMRKHRTDDANSFNGNPLDELFQECIDAMNYCDAIKETTGYYMGDRWLQFYETAIEVQTLYQNLKSQKP